MTDLLAVVAIILVLNEHITYLTMVGTAAHHTGKKSLGIAPLGSSRGGQVLPSAGATPLVMRVVALDRCRWRWDVVQSEWGMLEVPRHQFGEDACRR